jgi:predicted acylesterase/phospholipase RssA
MDSRLMRKRPTGWRFMPGRSGQTALCLSGGGIRSAAFGLGILQGLARHGLLDQFYYLSIVSGGGYIASWLTAWRHRANHDDVLEHLKEPPQTQRLRFNQTFLTPKIGLASADTRTALGALLRNRLLNWLVFLPLLAGLLVIPRIIEALLLWVERTIRTLH